MKNKLYFLGGFIAYIGMAIILSSYGNMKAHRNINEAILNQFNKRFFDGIFTHPKFKNYLLDLNNSVGLSGKTVESSGKLSVNEITKSYSPKDWIREGGFTADEPEWPASLVHFYDPTAAEGQRYLKDYVSKIESITTLSFNPRVDHIEWATNDANHAYNWNNGKAALRGAFETDDPAKREELMAFAWRSLGETLHMIGDMGCPAHVRDDAHPGLFSDKQLYKNFGNADPYENICEQLTDQLINWGKGAVDPDLKEKFSKAKTVKMIAIDLASYTNQNYFTDETISGNGIAPKIHPDNTYASPKLENCEYDPATYSYKKTISGHEVIMCRDLTYAMYLFEKRGYPYIDRICVESQAEALMPQIAEAGANTIRLFIPEIKIEISELKDNSVKGQVIHTPDQEYTEEIKYTGEVELIRISNREKVGTVQCQEGVFDTSLDTNELDVDWETDGIMAQISCGRILIRSAETLKNPEQLEYTYLKIEIRNPTNPFSSTNGDEIKLINIQVENRDIIGSSSVDWGARPDWIGKIKWEGNNFSSDYEEEYSGDQFGSMIYHYKVKISGRISKDHSKLENLSAYLIQKYDWPPVNEYELMESEINVLNVPLAKKNSYMEGSMKGIDLTDYVGKVYHRSSSKNRQGEIVSSYEVDGVNLSDPGIELKLILH